MLVFSYKFLEKNNSYLYIGNYGCYLLMFLKKYSSQTFSDACSIENL